MKRLIFLFALLLAHGINGQAASLTGKVIEVKSGDVITISNLNRPVRVKLLGVDAPELGQPFADVAKKHLYDLVYDKPVTVEYSGIGADSSVTGRVLLNQTDIGAQMIRDGAAWFDLHNQGRLSVEEREVYQQSEQAARGERRGLWQAENPVAPWEFVKAQTLRRNPAASLNTMLPATAKVKGPTPELTNLHLMTRGMPTPPPTDDPEMARAMTMPGRRNWQQLRPEGEGFSALVPEDGKQQTTPIPFGDRMIDVNVYMVREGWSIFSVMWITGPSYGETDKSAMLGTLRGFLKGVGEGFDARAQQQSFNCEPQSERNISAGGYTGTEFDLTSCTVPAKARVFTRVVGDQRQMYLGAVFFMEDDENIGRFLRGFTVKPQRLKVTKVGK